MRVSRGDLILGSSLQSLEYLAIREQNSTGSIFDGRGAVIRERQLLANSGSTDVESRCRLADILTVLLDSLNDS